MSESHVLGKCFIFTDGLFSKIVNYINQVKLHIHYLKPIT
jgi:hypothetical protein